MLFACIDQLFLLSTYQGIRILDYIKKFTPSAHNAITSEDPSEDTDDIVRAAIGDSDSNSLPCYLSNSNGIGT